MAYLIAIFASIALLAGFLALTRFEAVHGTRVLGSVRRRLDTRAERVGFVVSHVDWAAFTNHMVRTAAARIAHDLAHATLLVVRVLERMLTRFVKYLRSRRHQVATVTEKKKFDFRDSLKQFRSTLAQVSVVETDEQKEEAIVTVPEPSVEEKRKPSFDISK